MNKERFAKLIKAVEDRPEDRFNMRFWGCKSPCGTVCCAFGAYIEANPDSGFSLRAVMHGNKRLEVFRNEKNVIDPIYAAAEHFDIDCDDASDLFAPEGDPTKRDFLKVARHYMATH